MDKVKRILVDIIEFERSVECKEIDNCHIYYSDEDITKIYLLLIGPSMTPYEGGFYMFEIFFKFNYPKHPPIVTFLTTSTHIRFHPNLYSKGKVCLSILGTWEGPQWSPAMSLKSIILSLQSILTTNPMKNEPGYENINIESQENIDYNIFVTYHNIEYAIIHMLENPPVIEFKTIIGKIFEENKDKYIHLLQSNQKKYVGNLPINTIYHRGCNYLNFNNLILPC